MGSVLLLSQDLQTCCWCRAVAELSPVLKDIMEVCEDGDDTPIPVPFGAAVLECIGRILDEDCDSKALKKVKFGLLADVLHATDFLQIDSLRRRVCKMMGRITARMVRSNNWKYSGEDSLGALPRHLKLEVLAHVARIDPECAVCCLPTVGDEWAELARDPAVYEEVVLSRLGERSLVVREALNVGRIVMEYDPSFPAHLADLRQSQVLVHRSMKICLRLGFGYCRDEVLSDKPNMIEVLRCGLDIAWRSRAVLRDLELGLNFVVKEGTDSAGRSIAHVLAGMECLRALRIDLHYRGSNSLPYAGEFKGLQTSLTHLKLEGRVFNDLEFCTDLLDAARDSLQEVAVPCTAIGLVPAMKRCRGIKAYRGPAVLDAKQTWPALERVVFL